MRRTNSPRFGAGTSRHFWKASVAASMARFTSGGVADLIVANVRPSIGERTSIVSPPPPAADSPPIQTASGVAVIAKPLSASSDIHFSCKSRCAQPILAGVDELCDATGGGSCHDDVSL